MCSQYSGVCLQFCDFVLYVDCNAPNRATPPVHAHRRLQRMNKKRGMQAPPSAPKPKVLFIGNSLTSYHAGSMDAMCREFGFETAAKVTMGATLAKIWRKGGWAAAMRGYDFVVLQDDLPEYGVRGVEEHWRELLTPFLEAVKLFVGAARDAGAVPLLYMTHSYARLGKTQQHDICRCHAEAERLFPGTAIAPCGLAHHLAHPRLMEIVEFSAPLLDPDREHQSTEGLYLNACCVALVLRASAALTDAVDVASLDTPEALEAALPWAPADFEGEKAEFLRQAARDAIAAWPTYMQDAGLT